MPRKFLYFFSLSPRFPSRFAVVERNPWLKALLRECTAEYLATLFLFLIGLGVNAQLVIGAGGKGDYFANQFAWGLGIMFGVYIAGGVSGAHMNPAVTLAMAIHRKFEYWKVLGYWIAQFLGAFSASALVYFVYYDAIHAFDIGDENGNLTDISGSIFYTVEAKYLTVRGAIIDNIVGTAILTLGVSALNDAKNFNPVAANLAPFLIGMLVTMIVLCFGMNAGAAINPVRDFPQRLFCSMSGWGLGPFQNHENYWLIPVLCPFAGGFLGVLVYDLLVGVHHDEAVGGMESSDDDLESGALVASTSGSGLPVHQVNSGGVNSVHYVGGRNTSEQTESTGMVHVNEAFLDPRIKASADATFYRHKKDKKSMQQPLLDESK